MTMRQNVKRAYPAQALAEQGVDDAVAASLRVRLATGSGSKTVDTVARSAAVRPSHTRQTGGRAHRSRASTIERRIDN
jgi:hypothetical protein